MISATDLILTPSVPENYYCTKRNCKLKSEIKEQGLTLIPLKIYFQGLAKLELGLAKGKKLL